MKTKFLSAFLAAAALFGCSQQDVVQDDDSQKDTPAEEVVYAPIELSRAEAEMMARQNAFAADFFGKVLSAQPKENMMVSPLSLSMGLSLIANGTAGETRDEILKALGFEAGELEALNSMNVRVSKGIGAVDEDVKTTLANSIWVDKSFTLKDAFVKTMKETYSAEVFNETLATPGTMALINGWAADNTGGLIDRFLDEPLDPSTMMVLMNALYFNGGWTEAFEKDLTKKEPFYNADGSQAQVDMMGRCATGVPCFHDKNGATWVKQYFGNRNFSITFIMADEGVDINNYLASVEDGYQDVEQHYLTMTPLRLFVPRFTIETEMNNVKELLAQMGITKLFTSADFSPMTNMNCGLDAIVQKTKIELDEEGAKAASVLGSFIVSADIDSEPVKYDELRINRPFGFIIKEEGTGAILFMGRVLKF